MCLCVSRCDISIPRSRYGVTVRDGQSYVSDYFYTESTDRVVHLGPGKGLNPNGGRVSMTGTKTSPNTAADWIHVDNWVGNFTILKSNIQVQSDQGATSVDLSASTAPATSNILFLVSSLLCTHIVHRDESVLSLML